MNWFVRYLYGGRENPKYNVTIEADTKPEAIAKVKDVIPDYIYNRNDFMIIDCVKLTD